MKEKSDFNFQINQHKLCKLNGKNWDQDKKKNLMQDKEF
jgi:hypothetical protein